MRQLPNGNLFISPVEYSDQAVYRCHAQNDLGEASSTGNLTVLSKPADLILMFFFAGNMTKKILLNIYMSSADKKSIIIAICDLVVRSG